MARIRTIKPEFWTDDRLTECSMSARLLFIGTWNFADDAGNLDRSAKQIKARVFPIDNVDCEKLIQELLRVGLLIEYSVSDKKYLHIQNFHKHQVINRPSKPTCPPMDGAVITHTPLSESSVPKGREGKGKEDTRVASLPDWLPLESWNGWIASRKKKPTARALNLAIAKLESFRAKGIDPAAVLDASTLGGWTGLYEPKDASKPARLGGLSLY